jgi:hypothetical protein
MKRWLQAYVIYLAGAVAVVCYVLWLSRQKENGLDLSALIGKASPNGHGSAAEAEQLVDETV